MLTIAPHDPRAPIFAHRLGTTHARVARRGSRRVFSVEFCHVCNDPLPRQRCVRNCVHSYRHELAHACGCRSYVVVASAHPPSLLGTRAYVRCYCVRTAMATFCGFAPCGNGRGAHRFTCVCVCVCATFVSQIVPIRYSVCHTLEGRASLPQDMFVGSVLADAPKFYCARMSSAPSPRGAAGTGRVSSWPVPVADRFCVSSCCCSSPTICPSQMLAAGRRFRVLCPDHD